MAPNTITFIFFFILQSIVAHTFDIEVFDSESFDTYATLDNMFGKHAPIGFVLHRAARVTGSEFEAFLFGGEGGSLSTWLVLLALHDSGTRLQGDLAEFAGIRGPTLTHHLNAMETEGLICRTRSGDDRRVHLVTITKAGRAHFRALEAKAKIFDDALQKALRKEELAALRDLLRRVTEAALKVRAS